MNIGDNGTDLTAAWLYLILGIAVCNVVWIFLLLPAIENGMVMPSLSAES